MSANTRRLARARAAQRGFTLLELLAATVASLLVIIAALMLSRGSTRLFVNESRIGASQFSLRLGLDRLRADVERAGFMSTPNARLDPDTCPDPSATIKVQSLKYAAAGTPATEVPATDTNGLSRDRLVLQANYASTDSYSVSTIDPSAAAGYKIYLQRNTGAMSRLMQLASSGSADAAIKSAFPKSHILRLTNAMGTSQFLVISDAAIDSTGLPVISALSTPPILFSSNSGAVAKCGVPIGNCFGCTVNSIQNVEYYMGSLKPMTAYAWAYPSGTRPTDVQKYDLIRKETDYQFANPTYTIVAEYVVDLAFSFSADVDATGGEPNVVSFPFGDARNTDYGADVTTTAAARPQRIRTVRYRVATRSRETDRDAPAGPNGPGLLRYALVGTSSTEYARVRTIIGEVSLINHQGIRW